MSSMWMIWKLVDMARNDGPEADAKSFKNIPRLPHTHTHTNGAAREQDGAIACGRADAFLQR